MGFCSTRTRPRSSNVRRAKPEATPSPTASPASGTRRSLPAAALTSVTIPGSVNSIGGGAFEDCTNLSGVYFQGNPPSFGLDTYDGDNNATIYYLPGTRGWDGVSTNGLLTALWLPQMQTSRIQVLAMQTNEFGFNITWASGMAVIVEATTDLVNTNWIPVATNTLTSGSSYFSDPKWTNYPGRFYRLRWP